MTISRTIQRLAILLFVTGVAAPALAQNSLARAKDLYASAAYDDALQMLATLHPKETAAASEVAAYQVFCLLALGRTAEASDAVKTLVADDPLYHPPDTEASPRVRAFFDDARRPLLPDIVRQAYATGKAAFDRQDFETARDAFDRVLALVDDMGESADQGMTDLRTVAKGFRDLSLAAAAPPAPVKSPEHPEGQDADGAAVGDHGSAAASSAGTKPAAPPAPTIYGPDDKDVNKPVAITQILPPWWPENGLEARRDYDGTIDLIIDEQGDVVSATITTSVQPRYDPELIKAAQSWRFRPATKNGVAVRYRYRLKVHLSGHGGR